MGNVALGSIVALSFFFRRSILDLRKRFRLRLRWRRHFVRSTLVNRTTARWQDRNTDRNSTTHLIIHTIWFHVASRDRNPLRACLGDHVARRIGHLTTMYLWDVSDLATLDDLGVDLRNHAARDVGYVACMYLRHHLASVSCHHLAMMLRDHPTRRVWDLASMILRHHSATHSRDHLAMLLGHHVASRVANLPSSHFGDLVGSAASNHLGVLLRDHVASRVADLAVSGAGDHPANGVWNDLAMPPGHVVAARNLSCLDLWTGNRATDPPSRHLHRIVDDRTGAVVRTTCTWIERPRPRESLASHDDWTGTEMFFRPVSHPTNANRPR